MDACCGRLRPTTVVKFATDYHKLYRQVDRHGQQVQLDVRWRYPGARDA